jgi:hypothetical protein
MTVDELVAALKEYDKDDLWKIVVQAQAEIRKREKEPKTVKRVVCRKECSPHSFARTVNGWHLLCSTH